jgi:predicted RNase H-like HicB family nuclease
MRKGSFRFTAVYTRLDSGWIAGYVEELPFVHAEGRTLKETKERLKRTLAAAIAGNRITTRMILDELRLRYFCRDWIYLAI